MIQQKAVFVKFFQRRYLLVTITVICMQRNKMHDFDIKFLLKKGWYEQLVSFSSIKNIKFKNYPIVDFFALCDFFCENQL